MIIISREEKKQEIPTWRAWLTVENLTANYPVFIFITVAIAILVQIGFIMVSPVQ